MPWEPKYSLGALLGCGLDWQTGDVAIGLKLNAEFLRLTTEGNAPGQAIDHRYNIQVEFGYTMFKDH